MSQTSKYSAAVKELATQGYVWFPGRGVWVKAAGLPLEELKSAPGWYRCAQVKKEARSVKSWDGYTFVTKNGDITHFDTELRERTWKPPIGYENCVCFQPIDIRNEFIKDIE